MPSYFHGSTGSAWFGRFFRLGATSWLLVGRNRLISGSAANRLPVAGIMYHAEPRWLWTLENAAACESIQPFSFSWRWQVSSVLPLGGVAGTSSRDSLFPDVANERWPFGIVPAMMLWFAINERLSSSRSS